MKKKNCTTCKYALRGEPNTEDLGWNNPCNNCLWKFKDNYTKKKG